jgi:hypothetical protein
VYPSHKIRTGYVALYKDASQTAVVLQSQMLQTGCAGEQSCCILKYICQNCLGGTKDIRVYPRIFFEGRRIYISQHFLRDTKDKYPSTYLEKLRIYIKIYILSTSKYKYLIRGRIYIEVFAWSNTFYYIIPSTQFINGIHTPHVLPATCFGLIRPSSGMF